ncbi:MAG: ribosome small subunit-dependent GTPase A [Erysipelotrichaceae bacterium]|nr:ribosome small subunit-dependent GTPase A [Erysipelotrichaceae bacterium]
MQGFIIKAIAGDFFVYNNEDKKTYVCKARGQIRNQKMMPICGDEVIFDYDEKANYSLINKIIPRKNELIRPLIANVDVALIVMSTKEPNFDSYLVDKLIIAATMQNIEPIIIVSKCEFIDEELKQLIENYKFAGYKVIEISSHQNINIKEVHETIKGKKVVLCGQSAVGKSTLINTLLASDTRSIGSFSQKLGRGKHETREVEYIRINEAFVADSPGFSRLDIKVELTTYARLFKDFSSLANKCRFSSCLHVNEPSCAIKNAVNEGIIHKKRYENYIHLMNEIKDGKKVWRKK